MNWKLVPALACGIATALAQSVPVPKTTLVPATADSHPLGAASQTIQPVDLAKAGYVEEEYILSGKANIYDWLASGSVARTVSGPYADRILVRHPANPARFSGTVVVEPMNSARRFDWAMMWSYLHEHLIEHGDAWVGVTMPGSVAGLQKFNPARYASLSFANPALDAPCAGAKGGPAATEEGLRWDVLSQVAASLKSGAPGQPMAAGFKVEFVYLTTQTGDLETYINAIHSQAILTNNKPVYDGYLVKNPTAPARISGCTAAIARTDPRTIIKDINVPVIAVVAQGEVIGSRPFLRPDADAPQGRYRLYEIAGAAHIDKFAYDAGFPSFPDEIAAVGAAQGSPAWPFNAMCDPPIPLSTHPLLKYSYDAALANLDQWARKAIAPPKAERIQVTEGETPALVLDEYGHAKGGVRSPWVDVPAASYTTTSPGPGTCAELGHVIPFTPDRIKTLYPTALDYTKKVTANVDALVRAHWFTESDGKKMKADLIASFGK